MKQCAFLTMDNLENFECYDSLLYQPLKKYGWMVTPVSWRNRTMDWNQFEVVIIRSPWDYQDNPELFLEVLEEIEDSRARLENPLKLVKWNIDKKYLQHLQQKGIAIVPSLFDHSFNKELCDKAFTQFNCKELVIKPTVSANADDTYRITPDSQKLPTLETVFSNRSFLMQPFLPQIVEEGEFSLFYFGGIYSHTILKTPKKDDFRVQEEHGGKLQLVTPEPALRKAGDMVFDAIAPVPLYGRVDFVRNDDSFWVMEVELIEPSLYFNMDPSSPDRFAKIFTTWMKNQNN